MLTTKQIYDLDNMNEASRLAGGVGTIINALEGGTTGNLREINQTVTFDEFTDGGGASGTFTLTAGTIPVKATVLASAVTAVVGFTGDTSAVLTIGDGTDVDRYNTGTINVFATAADGVATGAVSGVAYHAAAKSVVLTVTSATAFADVDAGSVTVRITYLV